MTTRSSEELVLVEYEYEYTTRDGSTVSIKPNERYILLSKTNDHWWHVCKDENTKPFYLPAKYVKQLPTNHLPALELVPPNGEKTAESQQKGADSPEEKVHNMSLKVIPPTNCHKIPEIRLSTFGLPQGLHDFPQGCIELVNNQQMQAKKSTATSAVSEDTAQQIKRHSWTAGALLCSVSTAEFGQNRRSRAPSFSPGDSVLKQRQPKLFDPPVVNDAEQQKYENQTDCEGSENIYESIEDIKDTTIKNTNVTDKTLAPPPLSDLDHKLISAPVPCPTAPVQGPLPSLSAVLIPTLCVIPAPPPVPSEGPASVQAESEGPDSAVYVNVTQLRKTVPQSLPLAVPQHQHRSLDSEGWEVHTDHSSRQQYYYHPVTGQTTWEHPFGFEAKLSPEALSSPSSVQSPLLSPSSLDLGASDWEALFDEISGCHYFYNHISGETSWEPPEQVSSFSLPMDPPGTHKVKDDGPPPLPVEDYPTEDPASLATFTKDYSLPHLTRAVIPRVSLDSSTPQGWACSLDSDGHLVFTSDATQEQWIKSVDDRGQTYYYSRDGSKSQWHLPEVVPSQPRVGNGLKQEGVSVFKNWRHTMGPSQFSTSHDDLKFFPSHKRNVSDYGSDASSSGNSPELQHCADRFRQQRNLSSQSCEPQQSNVLEKAGILNKTKVSDGGKKIRKNWSQSWTVLHGGVLTFHKDPKSAPAGASNKTNQIVPEFTIELRGATIGWAPKEKSSKKNVLELKTRTGSEFLIQYDTDSIINDWHKVITDTIRQLELACEEEDTEAVKKTSPRLGTGSSSSDAEQKKVRTKLLKFLQKRPTLQSVKEKGYIRDNVFGCALGTLCAQERTTIPSFVETCIRAVENRGLDIDGIYRVSGNLAVIQKLRYKADHEELDLEDGQWEDIHVITGALKLFFRELPEPLFPYSHFNNFIAAIKINDYAQKVSYMSELVKSLPQPNHDTMELLFRHLRMVIEHGAENRMTVQNVAIVFGPTLLRPEVESSNITMHMVFQNQIVEFILLEYDRIF